jgi:5-(carboxyamino)imidazole ribonucleotide synthase
VVGAIIKDKGKKFPPEKTVRYLRRQLQSMKAGILGGGQLGRMLLQAAINYPVETYVLENDPQCPSAHLCHHFVQGDIKDFDTVYNFGKKLDVLTIEIEAVNTDALEQLEAEGVKVYPSPSAIKIINNKILQKEFYYSNGIPSPEFVTTDSIEGLREHVNFLPAVHKIATGGYDGRGVQLLVSPADIDKGFNGPALLEKMVNIKQEIAVMVAMNDKGETAIYPPAEMVFDPVLNQLDFQISPALLADKILWKAEAMALKVVKSLNSAGIFAVEMFVDHNDEVYVNETAPRVHNSGHHTIEANYSSQFDMLWRVLLNYALGNTDAIQSSAIVNIVGADGFTGNAVYEGLDDVLKIDNAFVHLYGKHVTILSNDRQELIHQANKVKHALKVVSSEL